MDHALEVSISLAALLLIVASYLALGVISFGILFFYDLYFRVDQATRRELLDLPGMRRNYARSFLPILVFWPYGVFSVGREITDKKRHQGKLPPKRVIA